MIKLVNVSKLSHEEWLEYRKRGIGGSDAAAVCGLSPYKSPVIVYLDKTGEADTTIPDNERMRIGRDLEEYVAQRFSEATGKKVRRNNYMMQHESYPFMLADIDREIVGENAILECKTTNSYCAKDWELEPPLHYQIQCLHYLAVTGKERCYIAVLIGNEEFKWFTIERNEDTINDLIALEQEFWLNNVQAHQCPPPDGSPSCGEFLKKQYPHDDGETQEISMQSFLDCKRLAETKAKIKALKDEEAQLEQNIKNELKTAAIGSYDGETVVTWKSQRKTTLDTKRIKKEAPELYEQYGKTSESRTFSLKLKLEA